MAFFAYVSTYSYSSVFITIVWCIGVPTDERIQFVGLFCTINIHIAVHGENQPVGEVS